MVEESRWAVAAVALRISPFLGGVGAGRHGRNDPCAVDPLALLVGGIVGGLRCRNPALALKVGDDRGVGFGAELVVESQICFHVVYEQAILNENAAACSRRLRIDESALLSKQRQPIAPL